MASSLVQQQLEILESKCIEYLEVLDDPESALFLAERLCSHSNTPEYCNLLARAYMSLKKFKCVTTVIKNCLEAQDAEEVKKNVEWNRRNRYLLAKAYYMLGDWDEAENSMRCVELRMHHSLKFGENLLAKPVKLQNIPNRVSGLMLLGKIYEKMYRQKDAINLYLLTLKFDPFRYEAFERLCFLGANVPASCAFSSLHYNSIPEENLENIVASDSILPRHMNGTHMAWRRALASHRLMVEPTEYETIKSCLKYIEQIAEGIYQLSIYNCRTALQAFREVNTPDLNSPYVLSKLGRTYFELAKYERAALYFGKMFRLRPHDDSCLDYYSTALWHLQQGSSLSTLAEKAVASNRLSPLTWVVVGNLFSLNKEHDVALKFFQRSLQLDPHYCYAHTLCGYEVLSNEDFDKSLEFFKKAVKLNSRFYNAYYGIGTVKLRQEKFASALKYFDEALKITPEHAVLHCYRGVVLESLGNLQDAIESFELAISLSNSNYPVAQYFRAKALIKTGEFNESLRELHDIAKTSQESEVFVTMATVYRKINQKSNAMQCLEKAKIFASSESDQIPALMEDIAKEIQSENLSS